MNFSRDVPATDLTAYTLFGLYGDEESCPIRPERIYLEDYLASLERIAEHVCEFSLALADGVLLKNKLVNSNEFRCCLGLLFGFS